MKATLEQVQSDLPRLVHLVQQGEEVVITSRGLAVAKLTRVSQPKQSPDRQAWLARLAALGSQVASGKPGLSVEQILDEDRGR